METIDYWTPLWNALYQNGASAKSKDATHRFWLSLPPEQQAIVSQTIERKVAAGDFVWYNPIRAIQENMRRIKQPEPTNYRGLVIPTGLKVYSAKWNGSFGMYTAEDIEKFQMEQAK